MNADESATETSAFATVAGSSWAARVVYLILLLIAAAELVLFVFQLQAHPDAGLDARLDEISPFLEKLNLLGHLLRVVLCLCLVRALHLYLYSMHDIQQHKTEGSQRLAIALRQWWRTLAVGLLVMAAYGTCVALAQRRSTEPANSFASATPVKITPVQLEFRRAENEFQEGLVAAQIQNLDRIIWLYPTPTITNAEISSIKLHNPRAKTPGLQFTFTSAGAERLTHLTTEHQGALLAMILDGQVVAAPVIHAAIGKDAILEIGRNWADAHRIVSGFQSTAGR